MLDLEQICREVRNIAIETGNFITEQRKSFSLDNIEIKGTNDFVTTIDKGSEERIINGLQSLIPGAGFIAEENTNSTKGETYNWVIDPIDGTTNFIHDFPCYCISIALMRDEEIILGVIYEINLKECFYAWEGSKAYLNEKEIKVSKVSKLKDSLLGTGFPYSDYKRMDEYMDLFRELMFSTHGLRRPGSAAADLAYVACGRFDGFYEYSLKAWDVAAGAFIIQQAGGKICDFSGGDNYLFGKEIIATNGQISDELLAVVKKHFD